MANPIVPKYNANTSQITGPTTTQIASLTTGELVSNLTNGDLYIKMHNGDLRNLTPIHTVNTASGLTLESNEIKSLYNTQIGSLVDSVVVGGAASHPASYWQGKTVVEVLDTILFPDLNPTYTSPTISISGGVSGTHEVGSTINQTLTATGDSNDAGAFATLIIVDASGNAITNTGLTTTDIADVADQYGFANPNDNNRYTTQLDTQSVTVSAGSQSWRARATYGAGQAKKNNKGVTDSRTAALRTTTAPQAAETNAANFASSALTVNGIYPYFWGKSNTLPTTTTVGGEIVMGTANKVVADSNGTLSVTFAASNQYIWFAIPNGSTSKTKWYVNDTNQGNIGTSSDLFGAVQVDAVDSPDGYWNMQNYKIYISNYATQTSGAMQLRNS
jgi:hypothetical protein